MKTKQDKPIRWADFSLSSNGTFRVNDRLLRISEFNKPVTNPYSTPPYVLYDITGSTAEYLSVLYDKGGFFSGEIDTNGCKYRFSIRRASRGMQASGLVKAITQKCKHSDTPTTPLLDPLEPTESDLKHEPIELHNEELELENKEPLKISIEPTVLGKITLLELEAKILDNIAEIRKEIEVMESNNVKE